MWLQAKCFMHDWQNDSAYDDQTYNHVSDEESDDIFYYDGGKSLTTKASGSFKPLEYDEVSDNEFF